MTEPLPELRPAVVTAETAEEEVAPVAPMRAVSPGEAGEDMAAET